MLCFQAYGITNLITFMHSYAAEPEAGSETDTGSDTEDGSKPDTVSSPSCYAMPTAIVRNSKNLECQNKNKTDSRQQLMVNDEKNSVGSEMVTNQTDKQTAIKRLPVTRQLESVSKVSSGVLWAQSAAGLHSVLGRKEFKNTISKCREAF